MFREATMKIGNRYPGPAKSAAEDVPRGASPASSSNPILIA
jgi:hypothetical protein